MLNEKNVCEWWRRRCAICALWGMMVTEGQVRQTVIILLTYLVVKKVKKEKLQWIYISEIWACWYISRNLPSLKNSTCQSMAQLFKDGWYGSWSQRWTSSSWPTSNLPLWKRRIDLRAESLWRKRSATYYHSNKSVRVRHWLDANSFFTEPRK